MTAPLYRLRLLLSATLILGLTACAFPKRDAKGLPDTSVIEVKQQNGQWVAIPPECQSLFTEFTRLKYDSRPRSPLGCATYSNLANSVATPKDLVRPSQYSGQHVDTASDGVTRYRTGNITPLQDTNTTKSN